MTEAELIAEHWWWRRLVFADCDPDYHTTGPKKDFSEAERKYHELFPGAFWFWRNNREIAAWRYELARRACGCAQYPAYPELPSMCEAIFMRRNGHEVRPKTCHCPVDLNQIKKEKWWSDSEFVIQWNLNASDNALLETFLDYINGEREKNGLPTSKTTPKGKKGQRKSSNQKNRFRQPSWLWVELLDRSSHDLGPIRDTATLSKARKASAEFAAKFLETWKELNSLPEGTLEELLAAEADNPGTVKVIEYEFWDEFRCRSMPLLEADFLRKISRKR